MRRIRFISTATPINPSLSMLVVCSSVTRQVLVLVPHSYPCFFKRFPLAKRVVEESTGIHNVIQVFKVSVVRALPQGVLSYSAFGGMSRNSVLYRVRSAFCTCFLRNETCTRRRFGVTSFANTWASARICAAQYLSKAILIHFRVTSHFQLEGKKTNQCTRVPLHELCPMPFCRWSGE